MTIILDNCLRLRIFAIFFHNFFFAYAELKLGIQTSTFMWVWSKNIVSSTNKVNPDVKYVLLKTDTFHREYSIFIVLFFRAEIETSICRPTLILRTCRDKFFLYINADISWKCPAAKYFIFLILNYSLVTLHFLCIYLVVCIFMLMI